MELSSPWAAETASHAEKAWTVVLPFASGLYFGQRVRRLLHVGVAGDQLFDILRGERHVADVGHGVLLCGRCGRNRGNCPASERAATIAATNICWLRADLIGPLLPAKRFHAHTIVNADPLANSHSVSHPRISAVQGQNRRPPPKRRPELKPTQPVGVGLRIPLCRVDREVEVDLMEQAKDRASIRFAKSVGRSGRLTLAADIAALVSYPSLLA